LEKEKDMLVKRKKKKVAGPTIKDRKKQLFVRIRTEKQKGESGYPKSRRELGLRTGGW